MRQFLKYFAWILVYYLTPLIPFFIGGILTYYMHIIISSESYEEGFKTFISSFNYLALTFSIGIIGVLLEQNIRNYEPIIQSETTNKSSTSYCRIAYILSFVLWGMFLFCSKFIEASGYIGLEPFLGIFKICSLILFAYSTILVVIVQFSFKFQVQ